MNGTAICTYLASGALLIIGSIEAVTQTTPKCRPADARTASLISHLTYRITATDPREKHLRDNVYKIPVVTPSQISVVKDERVCGKLVEAYARDPSGWVPTSLYVIKLGSKHYVVLDPEHKAGQYSTVKIYNSKYVRIGGWTGG